METRSSPTISERIRPILAVCGSWFAWVLATTMGFGLGIFGVFLLTATTYWGRLQPTILGLTLFAFVGTMQWLALNLVHGLDSSRWWIPLTMAGWFLGGYGMFTIGDGASKTIQGILLGVPVGFAQYLFLRRRVHRAGWWICASIVSIAISWVLAGMMGGGDGGDFGLLFAAPLLGVLVGATTGVPLIWLLRHPCQEGCIVPMTVKDRFKGFSRSQKGFALVILIVTILVLADMII